FRPLFSLFTLTFIFALLYCDFITFSMLRLPPSSTLFPYTTLFRSTRQCGRPFCPARTSTVRPPPKSTTFRRMPSPMSCAVQLMGDRKSTRLNSSHVSISYAVFCLKKKRRTKSTQSDGRESEHNVQL